MKTILKLIYAWYRRKKELDDMQSYVWSELMRADNCNWDAIKARPKRILMTQYKLSTTWNKCDVWYCLEQFFVLRKENDELKRKVEALHKQIMILNSVPPQAAAVVEKNQSI